MLYIYIFVGFYIDIYSTFFWPQPLDFRECTEISLKDPKPQNPQPQPSSRNAEV